MVGLVINLLIYSGTCFRYFDGIEAEYYSRTPDILHIVMVVFSTALVLQIIAMLLLSAFPKVGLIFAAIVAFCMALIGLIFLMGYFSSYDKVANVDFTPYTALTKLSKANDLSVSTLLKFKVAKIFMMGALMIVIGIAVQVIGVDSGNIIAGLGILSLIHGFRLKGRVVLGTDGDNIIINPGFYSDTYILPAKDVTVMNINNSYIKISMKSASKEKVVKIRKKLINCTDVN